jgi:hypothetical protein
MEEWDEIEIEVSTTGLQASPSELHAVFELAGDHLSEVRDRHKMVMVESGSLPESHLADIAPERRMKWIIEELNGIAHDRGFTIPLLGASDSEISLFKGEIDGHSILKLQVNSDFIRKIPIPSDVSSIKAKLEDGLLKLDW